MSVGIEIGASYPIGPEDRPGYGLINAGHAGGVERSAWATGNPAMDKYISAFDAAIRNKRVGGATYLARDLETAARLANMENISKFASSSPTLDPNALPNFGGASGIGVPTLRANPFEGRLMNLLNDPSSLANDPGYKFEMDQGQQALARSAAAKGMTGSGNTLAALLEHGQGLAATRRGQEVDRLSSLVQGRDSVNANLYGTDVGANTSRYGTDVASKTSMWNTAQKINADNYWNAQKMANGGGGGGGGGGGWSPTLGNAAPTMVASPSFTQKANQRHEQNDREREYLRSLGSNTMNSGRVMSWG